MPEYRARMIDHQLKEELEAFGAVAIVGPKWCGKTTTAERLAKSTIYMQDPEKKKTYTQMARLKPSSLLEGEKPRLIDEWQTAPQLWDAIRFDVDTQNEQGLYILTGSVTIDEKKILHSGAGRIVRMRMRTMSLYESGDSTGEISLNALFLGIIGISGHSKMSVDDIARAIVRGGWPSSIGKKITLHTGRLPVTARRYWSQTSKPQMRKSGIHIR